MPTPSEFLPDCLPGLLGWLWEFPIEEILGDQEAEAGLVRPLWDRFLGLRSLEVHSLGAVRHAYSHSRLAAHVYLCPVNPLAGKAIPDAFRFIPLEELALHPLTGLTHKALKRAQPFLRQKPFLFFGVVFRRMGVCSERKCHNMRPGQLRIAFP